MTDLFPNAWHVARREYIQRVRTRTFAVVTAVLAVIGLGLAGLPLIGQVLGNDEASSIGVYVADADLSVDPAQSLQLALDAIGSEGGVGGNDGEFEVRPVENAEAGGEQVRGGDLDGLLTIARATNGELTFDFLSEESPASRSVLAVRSAATQVAIGDRLARAGIDPSQAGALFAPVGFDLTPVDPTAQDPEENFGPRYVVALAMTVLTFMAVLTYGQWVATSVAEEKSSRVMELLITAASPRQLLAGKVLGTGAAGLTQYVVVVIAALVGLLLQGVIGERLLGTGPVDSTLQAVDPVVLLIFAVFFAGGFLLYALLYAALGSTANRMEDVQQVVGPMVVVAMIGYFASVAGLNAPDADWVRILSLVPFFTPYLMPARLLLGSVGPLEILLAAGLTAVALALALWVAARIYSAGVLLYGQRLSLRNVLRAVRVDR
jgi:ABC-2 type transport system permease protein